MGWVRDAVQALKRGESVEVCPRGTSMRGRIEDGDRVTIEPCDAAELMEGDIVLVRVEGAVLLHLIREVDDEGRLLIGNNLGKINGRVERRHVQGRVTQIEPMHLERDAPRRKHR